MDRRRARLLTLIGSDRKLTYRQLAVAAGLASPSTVHYHVTALVDQGFIGREPRAARNLWLTEKGKQWLHSQSNGSALKT